MNFKKVQLIFFILISVSIFASSQSNEILSIESIKNGVYVGVSQPNNDFMYYRLQIKITNGKVENSDFQLFYGGSAYSKALESYALDMIKEHIKKERFEIMAPYYEWKAKLATSYSNIILGVSTINNINKSELDIETLEGLKEAWKDIVENRLMLIEHRGEPLGDNNNAPHDWNEYIPKVVQDYPNRKVPLFISLHGATQTILDGEGLGFAYLGAKKGFITVVPDATKNSVFNANLDPKLSNDEEFILNLIQKTKKAYSINEYKVYMSGLSNGGATTAVIGLLHPEIFAGIAPISGLPGAFMKASEYFVERLNKQLDEGLVRLPIIYGTGTDDKYNYVERKYARVEWPLPIWEKINNINITSFNKDDPFGTPLLNANEFEKYGVSIKTGKLYSNDEIFKYDYIMLYSVENGIHQMPNPYVPELIWDYLNQFSRDENKKIIKNGENI